MPSKENQSKTSKTARVMNLISKKTDPASAADGAGSASAPVSPIISSIAPDAEAASQIKNALEDELSGDPVAAPAPAPEARSAQSAAPEPQPEPEPEPVQAAPASEQPRSVQPAAPQPQPEPVQAAPSPEPQSAEPEKPRFLEPEDPGYINVMQVLVEEKASVYTKMFGLCQCKRCLEDVKALTLNNLPPKYVVLAEGDRIPRLTVYEGRFSSDITSQLLQACKFVQQRPHHSREE